MMGVEFTITLRIPSSSSKNSALLSNWKNTDLPFPRYLINSSSVIHGYLGTVSCGHIILRIINPTATIHLANAAASSLTPYVYHT